MLKALYIITLSTGETVMVPTIFAATHGAGNSFIMSGEKDQFSFW